VPSANVLCGVSDFWSAGVQADGVTKVLHPLSLVVLIKRNGDCGFLHLDLVGGSDWRDGLFLGRRVRVVEGVFDRLGSFVLDRERSAYMAGGGAKGAAE
jgi:hypothetical protein